MALQQYRSTGKCCYTLFLFSFKMNYCNFKNALFLPKQTGYKSNHIPLQKIKPCDNIWFSGVPIKWCNNKHKKYWIFYFSIFSTICKTTNHKVIKSVVFNTNKILHFYLSIHESNKKYHDWKIGYFNQSQSQWNRKYSKSLLIVEINWAIRFDITQQKLQVMNGKICASYNKDAIFIRHLCSGRFVTKDFIRLLYWTPTCFNAKFIIDLQIKFSP